MATSIASYEIRWDAAVASKKNYQYHKNDLAKGLANIIDRDEHTILES